MRRRPSSVRRRSAPDNTTLVLLYRRRSVAMSSLKRSRRFTLRGCSSIVAPCKGATGRTRNTKTRRTPAAIRVKANRRSSNYGFWDLPELSLTIPRIRFSGSMRDEAISVPTIVSTWGPMHVSSRSATHTGVDRVVHRGASERDGARSSREPTARNWGCWAQRTPIDPIRTTHRRGSPGQSLDRRGPSCHCG